MVQSHDLDFHHLADADDFRRILYKAMAHFAQVDQAILMDAHIHESTEIRHVGDDALKLHADFQIRWLVHAFLELDGFEFVAGIAAGFPQFR